MPNELFDHLCKPKTLYNGWHLTRNDVNRDFYLDDLRIESFAANLAQHVTNIADKLVQHTHRFSPVTEISIPKGRYGTRPGSILGISDRIVLWSLIKLIAPGIDAQMPDGVSSYRLKSSIRSGEEDLFKEKDEISIPFLKGKTINTDINPFSHWVYNWREFDLASRNAYSKGYRYLAVTDIAAYFENINLSIMRDLLLEIHHGEQNIVNLVIDAFQSWTVRTPNGYRPLRGIPQGSGICSFFGNMYLIPLDKYFSDLANSNDLIYLRYMDDIRIFCRSKISASRSILALEEQLRRIHLSVQTAKTKIYEPSEVKHLYDDPRIEAILRIRSRYSLAMFSRFAVPMLERIGKRTYDHNPPLSRRFVSREALFERSTRMWMNSLMYYGASTYISQLEGVVVKNSDPRYSELLIRSAKRFSSYSFNKSKLLAYIRSPENLYEYQECHIIESFRYMKGFSPGISSHCFDLLASKCSYNKKLSAIRYLAKGVISPVQLRIVERIIRNENDSFVRCNLLLILAQLPTPAFRRITTLLRTKIGTTEHDLINFVDRLTRNTAFTRGFLRYIFDNRAAFRLHDWIGAVAICSHTNDGKLRNTIIQLLRQREGREVDLRLKGYISFILTRLK